MIDLSQPKVREELDWIANLPASRQAERLLKMVQAGRMPNLPAPLALMQWGIEDVAQEFGLDNEKAEQAFQTAMMLLVERGPRAATLWLLNLDNPETEVLPSIRDAKTKEEAAKAALSLAD